MAFGVWKTMAAIGRYLSAMAAIERYLGLFGLFNPPQ
jgi:hypothetical protein